MRDMVLCSHWVHQGRNFRKNFFLQDIISMEGEWVRYRISYPPFFWEV
jgi:hypothetical protein